MENRRAPRTRKRLACTLEFQGGRSTGLILDVSANGLFVQTGAKLDPGDAVTLAFEPPGSPETLRLAGRVARRRVVPAQLKSVAKAGIGVEVEQAPEGFYAMIAILQDVGGQTPPRKPRGAASAAPRPAARSALRIAKPKPGRPIRPAAEARPALRRLRRRFKVEVHEIEGRGARIVEVEALNAAAAGRRALEETGPGWKVAGCEVA